MPPEDASTQAENTPATQLEAPTDAQEAAAFKADSALDPRLRADIQSAWNASIKEVGELDPEAEASKVAEEPKAASKPAAKAKPETEAAPEEQEAEAEKTDAEAVEKLEAKQEKRKLTQAENRELMQARIAQNQRFQRREQAQAQRFAEREAAIAKAEAQHRSLYEPLMRAKAAIEKGDFDGCAEGLGYKDWNTMQAEALEAVQSPVYKRMRQLEKDAEARRQQELEQQAQWQQAQAQQAQAAAIQEWKANLHDECVSDDDPAVAALVEARPNVVEALFAIQQKHFHTTAGDELSAHDAAVQFMYNVQEDYKFWSQFFEQHSESELLSGIREAATKPAKQANRGAILERQTAKKTSGGKAEVRDASTAVAPAKKLPSKTISQTQTAGASALKPMTDKELMKHFAPLIQQELTAA